MRKVLVTGAAGFIGMHVAIRFLRDGWFVIGLDSINDYYEQSLKHDRLKEIQDVAVECDRDFKFYKEDLNSDVWDSLLLDEVDAVIHLAGQAGVRYSIENPQAYLESNIIGFQRVIDFVRFAGIANFVYASSSSVYGMDSQKPFSEESPCNSPESFYAATKKANELVAHSYQSIFGLDSIGLRFFTVYGPWGRPDMAPMLFAKAALRGDAIDVFNYGNQRRDFTYIDDIVEGICLTVGLGGDLKGAHVFNIGRGEPVGLLDFITKLEEALGVVIKKNLIASQPGDVTETFASINKLQALTGYTPQVCLNDGIGKFVAWLRDYKKIT